VTDHQPVPLVVIVALAIEIRPLERLSDWEPCGALLGELVAAGTGTGGLSHRDVMRLRTWASNWAALRFSLREFYASNHDNPAVHSALWYVLGTSRTRPTGAGIGLLRRAWESTYGSPPSVDLLPRPATQEPPWTPT